MHKINIFSYWIKLKTTYTASLHERSLWPDREPKEILKSQTLCKELSSQVTDQTQYCASCKQDNRVWFASMSSGIFQACTPATADQSGGWGRRRYFPNSRDPNVPQHSSTLIWPLETSWITYAHPNSLRSSTDCSCDSSQRSPMLWTLCSQPSSFSCNSAAWLWPCLLLTFEITANDIQNICIMYHAWHKDTKSFREKHT